MKRKTKHITLTKLGFEFATGVLLIVVVYSIVIIALTDAVVFVRELINAIGK